MRKSRRRFSLLLGLCSCVVSLDAQKNDLAFAEELQEQFKDEKIAALGSHTMVRFLYNKGTVTIEETRTDSFIALERDHKQFFAEFYDDQSEIRSVNEINQKGARKPLIVADDYYHDDIYFHSDVRVVHYSLQFEEIGDIRIVECVKVYKDPKYFTQVYFHDVFPIVRRKVEFSIPDAFDVEIRNFRFGDFSIEESDKQAQDSKHRVYQCNGLEAYTDETQIDGISLLYPHLVIITKEYRGKDQTLRFLGSTLDVYNWYKQLVDGIAEDPSALTTLVKDLTSGKDSLSQIRNVFYWVQSHIRYIAFEDGIAGYQPDASQEVYRKRYGDCKGMANLTKHMLKLAGFDARLAWIGTNQLGYDYSLPSLIVDNHMICAIKRGDEFVFLDPTEKFSAYGEYAERIQGKQVMIEDGKNFIIATMPVRTAGDNHEMVRRELNLADQLLKGTVVETFHGESKADMLYQLNYLSKEKIEDAIQEYITDDDRDFSADSVVTSDFANRDQPFELQYYWTVRNAISEEDKELYIDLNQRKFFDNAYFKKERKFDYVFPFKFSITDETTLNIPDGYTVFDIPPKVSVSNQDFNISVDIHQHSARIVYKSHISFPTGRIRKEHFDKWNSAIRTLTDSYAHHIVLIKN